MGAHSGSRTQARRCVNRVAITGGSGFVGSHLCGLLAAGGRDVVSVDRRPPREGADGRVQAVLADVAAGSLDWLDEVDAVVHLAALPGVRAVRPARDLWRDNVMATGRVVAAAARRGVRVLVASSSSVYGDAALLPTPESAPVAPLSLYGCTKAAAESLALGAASRGADAVIARLFTVFGPGQRPDMALAAWIAALQRSEAVVWSVPAGGAREMTYVADAARGLVAALDRGRSGETYNIGGVGSVRLEVALSEVERALGTRAAVRRVAASGRDPVRTAACGAKAAREIGYVPAVGLRDGVEAQVRAAESPIALAGAA